MTNSGQLRPVFIAALPREIDGIVRGWSRDEDLLKRGIHLYWCDRAVVACAGMGANRVPLAIEAALALGPASELVSVGWAGACDLRVQVGTVIRPRMVIDARTGERFLTEDPETAGNPEVLVTAPAPAGAAEKARLWESYSASAVDMEAAVVARIAHARDLPFRAFKAISDSADLDLPVFGRFTTSTGQFREAVFALYLIGNPRLWKAVAQLARGSKLAGTQLRYAVESYIQRHWEPNE